MEFDTTEDKTLNGNSGKLTSDLVEPAFIFFFCTTSHPPSTAPCPGSYPLIGNLPGFLRNRHRFHDWVTDMLAHTPSSTLQVNSFLNLSHGICTANPSNIEHLLVTNFPNYIKGSRFLNVLYELLGHGIFNVDGQLWKIQRKIASHEFNTKSLKYFVSDVVKSEMNKTLIPFLFSSCDREDNDSVFDLQEVLSKFTFSTICKVAFGVNSSSSMSDLPFSRAFDDAVEICFFSRFLSPLPLIWKIKKLLNFGSEKRLKEAIEIINSFAMQIIRTKLQETDQKNQDLLSRFIILSSDLEFQDQEHKTKFLRDIVISFVLAGKDTTSSVLTWFFWLLAGNPRVTQLIYQELTEVASLMPEFTSETLRVRMFSYEELKKLHYLHATLSETMRLFPPVAINSRLTVDDDVLPDGTRVGRGWFADYSAYAMGRMEKIWGGDCREFKPERWLDENDGKFQPSDQFRFPVFHCGPRTCLGKELGYIQMKAIAAALIYEFEILAVDGGANAERMMNPPYVVSLLLKMKGGLKVKVKRRER